MVELGIAWKECQYQFRPCLTRKHEWEYDLCDSRIELIAKEIKKNGILYSDYESAITFIKKKG